MSDVISVTHDKSETDFPATMCFIKKDDKTKLVVGYVGDVATDLYKCVSEQGYIKDFIAKIQEEECEKFAKWLEDRNYLNRTEIDFDWYDKPVDNVIMMTKEEVVKEYLESRNERD